MTPDREQIRRDARSTVYAELRVSTGHHRRCKTHEGGDCDCYMTRPDYLLATDYLTALADLEIWLAEAHELRLRLDQAERERDEARERTRQADGVIADLLEERESLRARRVDAAVLDALEDE